MLDVIVHLEKAAINPAEKREEKEGKSVIDTGAAVDYKENESGDDQMDRPKDVETVDDIELDTYLRDKGNIGE